MTSASTPSTGRRLGLLLLGYLGVVVAVIVFAPFSFGVPTTDRVMLLPDAGQRWGDMGLNLVLFVPLGFLADRVGGGRIGIWRVLFMGVAASCVIELVQLSLVDRYSTLTDVIANGLGALTGGVASATLRRQLGTGDSLTERLFLDLPLLGICWLLLPMLWVESLQGPWLPSMSLAAAGGFAIAGAGRSNAARERQPARLLWPMVVGWSAIAALPALPYRVPTVAVTLASAVVAFLLGDRWWRNGTDRRVEPRAVRIILIALLPWFLVKAWIDVLNLQLARHLRDLIFEWLALGAGFTVLGYAVSEWRGRSPERWPRSALVPVVVAVLLAVAVARGRPILIVLAGVVAAFGALLFEVQRAHVVARRESVRGRRG